MLVVLTLPITILTLGLFLFVVNAATFGLVAYFLDGFHVAGFVPALLGSLLVSFISWLASAFDQGLRRSVGGAFAPPLRWHPYDLRASEWGLCGVHQYASARASVLPCWDTKSRRDRLSHPIADSRARSHGRG